MVGRRAELDRVVESVQLGLNVLVHGDSGSGLTTVLHQVLRRLGRSQQSHPRFVNAAEIRRPEQLMHHVAADLVPTVSVVGGTSGGSPVYSKFARYTSVPEGTVALVDNAPTRLLAETFGAHRDEVWAVPMSWVVTCTDRDKGAVLQPPADAFFDQVVELAALTDVEAASLLRRRTTKQELPAAALRTAVGAGNGNPRSLIQAARSLVLDGGDPDAVSEGSIRRAELQRRLSRPAAMLLSELISRGPSSASDRELQDACGWTRARLVQVFGELEAAGAVEYDEVATGRSGRPRKIYRSRF